MLKKGKSRVLRNVVAYLSDCHFPYEDKRAWQLTLQILEDIRPSTVFWGGDIVDCYAVSDFSRDPQRVLTLQDELDEAVNGMRQVRKLVPEASMYFLPGNHENRIERFKRRVVAQSIIARVAKTR
jgi:UDP-2,3-diacylglucosamine pyrophosphatase LpxH